MTRATDELLAAEYVLGTLAPDDRMALHARMAQDPSLAGAVSAWEERLSGLAQSSMDRPAVDAEAPAGLWNKVEAALEAELNTQKLTVVRHTDEGWLNILPGVDFKLLRLELNEATQTFMLRLQPGASVPPHDHPTAEECFMVEGEMSFGDVLYRKGDYVMLPAGVPHPTIESRHGGTVLIRGAIPH